ncbi:hypothetical protein BDA96_01G189100 [Sorghum bicolor]|uniref:Uncharacterized protein n=1 Tax=Sorghum bicolor TaxID=4558 RepID=A0A921V0K7_SORBI|nr:hypothetical protein BDA96_01G189100 [Sorghum bicolor]
MSPPVATGEAAPALCTDGTPASGPAGGRTPRRAVGARPPLPAPRSTTGPRAPCARRWRRRRRRSTAPPSEPGPRRVSSETAASATSGRRRRAEENQNRRSSRWARRARWGRTTPRWPWSASSSSRLELVNSNSTSMQCFCLFLSR